MGISEPRELPKPRRSSSRPCGMHLHDRAAMGLGRRAAPHLPRLRFAAVCEQRPDQLDDRPGAGHNLRARICEYQNDAFADWITLAVSGDTWGSAVMIDYEEQWLELRRLSQEAARLLAPPPRPTPDPTLEFASEDDRCSVDVWEPVGTIDAAIE